MGLLDALFSSDNYGGSSGGLLDLIRQSAAQNDQFRPGPGLPDSPSFASRFDALPGAPAPFSGSGRTFNGSSFDPAIFAPNQAQPIGVGGYQMPRIGSADQFTPQQSNAALPPNAQATQGQLPAPDAPPAAPPDGQTLPTFMGGPQPTSSFGDRLNAGLQNFANAGGPLQALAGGISGLVSGNRTDPLGMQQQNLKAQYDALVPTLGPQKAMLAVMNPEAGKVLLHEALTNKEKYGIISEDPLQGKQYGFINELEQTVNGKPIAGQGADTASQANGVQAMTDKISAMREKGASREELLKQIPTGYRDDVEALVTGKAVPANMGRAQVRGVLNILAHAVDKNYDEQMIPARIQMRKDFAGEGKNGQAIGSFNTAQHHIDKLSDDLETLSKYNGDFPSLNAVRGWLANNVNTNPKLRDSMQAVNDDMAAVSHEVANAYNSGHLSDHDMATWNKLTKTELPPDQLRRGISDFVDLLNGKRDSLNHMYRQTFGEDAPTIEKDKNVAITSKVHQRLPDYAGGSTAVAAPTIQEGATATNPQTGQKITFRNGKWQ